MTTAREAMNAELIEFFERYAKYPHAIRLTENEAQHILAALRSSVQEEPAARAVAVNDALDTGLAVHLRKARAFLEGVSDQLEQAEYCASTLPQSAQSSERNKTAEALHTGLGMDDLEIGDE